MNKVKKRLSLSLTKTSRSNKNRNHGGGDDSLTDDEVMMTQEEEKEKDTIKVVGRKQGNGSKQNRVSMLSLPSSSSLTNSSASCSTSSLTSPKSPMCLTPITTSQSSISLPSIKSPVVVTPSLDLTKLTQSLPSYVPTSNRSPTTSDSTRSPSTSDSNRSLPGIIEEPAYNEYDNGVVNYLKEPITDTQSIPFCFKCAKSDDPTQFSNKITVPTGTKYSRRESRDVLIYRQIYVCDPCNNSINETLKANKNAWINITFDARFLYKEFKFS